MFSVKNQLVNKVTLAAILATSIISTVAMADDATQLANQAQTAFALRDFNAPGINKAQEAASLFDKAANVAGLDALTKAKNLTSESAALYFVGNASTVNSTKLASLLKGTQVADQAVKLIAGTKNVTFDVATVPVASLQILKSQLTPEALNLLGDALYERGANLGQWGQANSVLQSLAKWPELRHNLEVLDTLGIASNHMYGGYRILGRAYFKIPGLLGGDMNKAAKYLSIAVAKTLVAGQIYSAEGSNNIFYADVLHEQGDDQKATAILTAFIKADPAKVDPANIPEIRQAQKDAAEDMRGW